MLMRIWLELTIDDFFLVQMTGAMTNSVLSLNVQPESIYKLESGQPSRLLLRIYGQGIDWMFSRKRELECTMKLAEAGIAPKWLGIFGNGRFEEYIENISMSAKIMREPKTSRRIARKLFYLHAKLDAIQYSGSSDESQMSILWKRLSSWRGNALEAIHESLKNNPDTILEPLTPRSNNYLASILKMGILSAEFDVEIKRQKAFCKSVASPLVLCHNDLHQGNIMLRASDRSIILVDFEYASLSPRGFDIANHFCEWAADYQKEVPDDLDYEDCFPNKEQQMNFILAYCSEATQVGISTDPDTLYNEVQAYIPISHLLWGHWGIIQACKSYIAFDYMKFSLQRFQQYELTKNSL
jgi:thiamine kinase-like enzyme